MLRFLQQTNESYIMEIDIETAFFLIHVGVTFIAIVGLLGLVFVIDHVRGTPMQRDIRRQLRATRKRVRQHAKARAKYRRAQQRRFKAARA